MNPSPIRIAQIIGKLKAGGVEAVINNYYRHIDHSKYQFDFFIDSDSDCEPPQELIDMGARYYVIPPYQKLPQHMSTLVKLFRENRYQIVHSNMNSLSIFSLCAAWIAGVPVRICHSHSTSAPGETKKNIMKYMLRPFSRVFPTHLCACSRIAGEWLYGKRAMEQGKVTIFNNAIDTKKFAFDPIVREEVRGEFGLDKDAFVIGHVGRFCYAKNQEFLIDIFDEIHKQNPEAVLLMVGIGEMMDKIQKKVKQSGLDSYVIFTGVRKDVERLYQAMDVFVLPSNYEGLPVVGIEAQTSGLPCFFSNNITGEVIITDLVHTLGIDISPKEWAEKIIDCESFPRSNKQGLVRKNGFDITHEAEKLTTFYTDLEHTLC